MKREQLAAYRAALELAHAKEFRLPMTTDAAVALAEQLLAEDFAFRHQVVFHEGEEFTVADVIDAYNEFRASPTPTDIDESIVWHRAANEAALLFWQVMEGHEVDGVEIIRKR
jgi:hypothetical protein